MNFVFPLADSVAISSQTVLNLQIVPISLVSAVRVANRDNRKVQNLSTFLDFGFPISQFGFVAFLDFVSPFVVASASFIASFDPLDSFESFRSFGFL